MDNQAWRLQGAIQDDAKSLDRFAITGDTGVYFITENNCTHQTAMYLYKRMRMNMNRLAAAGGNAYYNGHEITFDDFARSFIRSFKNPAWDALAADPEQAIFFLHEKKRLGLYDDACGDMTL